MLEAVHCDLFFLYKRLLFSLPEIGHKSQQKTMIIRLLITRHLQTEI